MTFSPINAQAPFLPLEFQIEGEELFFRQLIAERERMTATIINSKENGNYDNQEFLSCQQWFSTVPAGQPKKLRYAFRKIIDFGTLPNAGTKSVAHNISVDANYIFTRIYATATNPNTLFLPIPYINVAAPADSIQLNVDTTNVNITTTTANYTAFTTCYVVLEYLKNTT